MEGALLILAIVAIFGIILAIYFNQKERHAH
jgi:hypothetical protein